ncbi:MAG: 6-phosphofructokinase [Lachnospiraceae bacterium]|nr:6-phosphofructokinase [Lachnospiraceae bacterium]
MAVRKIAVLTSGGDAPGMNAALRAIVRIGDGFGMEIIGIRRGYSGLLARDFEPLTSQDMSDTVQKGGTILFTARCKEMMEERYQIQAAEILKEENIDALVVVGGDGSFRGAQALAAQGINVIGIPATIDLDLACTDYTIGFDTAVNTAMEAVDKVRDTSTSHERISIIEVMGRHAGYIALWCGIACGAEEILIPETYDYNDKLLIERIRERAATGKKKHIIINAEGVGQSEALAARIENATGIESRTTILGYMQRGGAPSSRDRVMASLMAQQAIEALLEGRVNRVVVYREGMVQDLAIDEALSMQKALPEKLVALTKRLVRR